MQWPFATFLQSPLARNWFFGATDLDFSTPAEFAAGAATCSSTGKTTAGQFWRGLLIAALMSCAMTWMGLHAGARDAASAQVSYEKKEPRSAQRPPSKTYLCGLSGLGGFFWIVILIVIALQPRALAHVGSPDVFLEGQAGAYRLLVTVRPPHAIPGVADVDILTTSDDVREVRIVPLPLTGPGAQFAPVADRAERSAEDPRLFTGHLWMMGAGAWQVRVTVTGDRGEGTLSVPVPTLPQSTLEMSLPLRAMLFVLMLLLAAGFVGIVSALAREARLAPGDPVDRPARVARPDRRRRRGRGRLRDRRPGQSLVVGRSVQLRPLCLQAARGDGDRDRRRAPQALLDRSWMDRKPPPRRLRARSRPPDAPVRRLTGDSIGSGTCIRTKPRPAGSSSDCRTCRPARTSCSPTSCTPPAYRRR